MTAEDVIGKLRLKFSEPEFVFLEQVRNGTGYSRSARTADALAMGVWPSRGLYLNGFEVKIARGDLKSELENPAKAESIAQFCDFWWLAVSEDKIVKDLLLPPAWGLIDCSGTKLKIKKQATLNEQVRPCDHLMLASILRNVSESYVSKTVFDSELAKKVQIEIKDSTFSMKNKIEELTERIQKFEESSGVKIGDRWNFENIGEAVKLVLARNKYNNFRYNAERLRDSAIETIKVIDEALSFKKEENND